MDLYFIRVFDFLILEFGNSLFNIENKKFVDNPGNVLLPNSEIEIWLSMASRIVCNNIFKLKYKNI